MSIWKTQFAPTAGMTGIGVEMPKTKDNYFKKSTLKFRLDGSCLDTAKIAPPTEQGKLMAEMVRNLPSARSVTTQMGLTPRGGVGGTTPRQGAGDSAPPLPANMRWPRVTPAWLKHDRQVLRFYGFFEEAIKERPDENVRIRQCVIMYFLEDGTLRISEPKQENSGIMQGSFLKRHRISKAGGEGYVGPADFRVGKDLPVYGRIYRITGADQFTRWFYQENGITLDPDQEAPEDPWEKRYRFTKNAEKGGLAVTGGTKLEAGNRQHIGRKLAQFLENDRKVLRFFAYWDDPTLYGCRIYVIAHYFLSDNSVEIHEAHAQNSGRDNYPVFFKRGPLMKENHINAYPGMLEPEQVPYLPEDLLVGSSFQVWGRTFVIYDCDDFTQAFYQGYLDVDQKACAIDVSEPPVFHVTLPPPPHTGPGKEEDSLINCLMLTPKAPKQNLTKLMTMSDEILRFECKMVTGISEDEVRRLIIRYFPADDEVGVWEIQQRNSGISGGKFCEKRRMRNPETGTYFKLADIAVGKTVTINCHPLQVLRADEHTLRYCEAHKEEFPYADPVLIARKLYPLRNNQQLNDPDGADPELLKSLAVSAGLDLIDHEVITLMRTFGVVDLMQPEPELDDDSKEKPDRVCNINWGLVVDRMLR